MTVKIHRQTAAPIFNPDGQYNAIQQRYESEPGNIESDFQQQQQHRSQFIVLNTRVNAKKKVADFWTVVVVAAAVAASSTSGCDKDGLIQITQRERGKNDTLNEGGLGERRKRGKRAKFGVHVWVAAVKGGSYLRDFGGKT